MTNNQQAKSDAGKPTYTWVPPALIRACERVRAFGNRKYHDPTNWRQVAPQRYWEACLRHAMSAWWDFRKKDRESGLRHIDHMICNLAFIAQLLEEEDGTAGTPREERKDSMPEQGHDTQSIGTGPARQSRMSVVLAPQTHSAGRFGQDREGAGSRGERFDWIAYPDNEPQRDDEYLVSWVPINPLYRTKKAFIAIMEWDGEWCGDLLYDKPYGGAEIIGFMELPEQMEVDG